MTRRPLPRIPAVLTLLSSFVIPRAAASLGEEYQVHVQAGVPVKMRDGVTLISDIYRPAAPGKFPVLLERTPYNRRDAATGIFLASRGYVVVLQDTRGRFDSGGEFYPFRYESQDGYDTVEWAASLEYSDGQVGMFGGSYVGATQMLAAMAQPPHLVAIFPYVTASEYYDGWTYQSGALMQWFVSSWTTGLALDTLQRKTGARSRPKEWVERMPLETYPLLSPAGTTDLAPYFRDWIEHERGDDYWRQWKISDHYHEMTVKALHSGGWHDIFLKGSIANFIEMRRKAATPGARNGQRLLVGPWAHAATSPEGKIGDVVFGKDAVLDMNQTILKWHDFALKGQTNEYAAGAPVRIFVMGDNVWRDEQEFPLARTRVSKLPPPSVPISMNTSRATPCQPSAGASVAARRFPRDRLTKGRTNHDRTCWSSRRRLLSETSRSQDSSQRSFTRPAPRATPISRRCWWTWNRMDTPVS